MDVFTIPHDALHFYNFLMKLFFLSSQIFICYYIVTKLRASYDADSDILKLEYLIVPSLVLAFVFANIKFYFTWAQTIREVHFPNFSIFGHSAFF